MAGTVTLVRTIWRVVAEELSKVPPLGCRDTLDDMLFIDGEGAVPNEHIPELRATLEAATVAPTDFNGAVTAISAILTAFNAQKGTTYSVSSPCSAPGHVVSGTGGCRPSGSGHTLLLNNGLPPQQKANLSATFAVGALRVQHGLAVSIQYPAP